LTPDNLREHLTLKELERCAEEIESGKVKPVSSDAFNAPISQLRKSIR
jgi:hypothetical protein